MNSVKVIGTGRWSSRRFSSAAAAAAARLLAPRSTFVCLSSSFLLMSEERERKPASMRKWRRGKDRENSFSNTQTIKPNFLFVNMFLFGQSINALEL